MPKQCHRVTKSVSVGNQAAYIFSMLAVLIALGGCAFSERTSELHDLVESGDMVGVRTRFQNNVNVDKTDSRGKCLLYVAALEGKTDVVDLLLQKGANPNQRASWKGGDSPMHAAAYYGRWEIMEKLIAHGGRPDAANRVRKTPLHIAAWHGYRRTVGVLLKSGASTKKLDKYGQSVLHQRSGLSPIQFASEERDFPATVKILIEAGADVNVAARMTYQRGMTPLMTACNYAPIEVVRIMLENGADPEVRLKNGSERDAFAMAKTKGREDVMKLLREAVKKEEGAFQKSVK